MAVDGDAGVDENHVGMLSGARRGGDVKIEGVSERETERRRIRGGNGQRQQALAEL